jgi:predicted RNA-binding protein with PUA-like domain
MCWIIYIYVTRKVDGNQGVKGLKYMREELVKELKEISGIKNWRNFESFLEKTLKDKVFLYNSSCEEGLWGIMKL